MSLNEPVKRLQNLCPSEFAFCDEFSGCRVIELQLELRFRLQLRLRLH